MFTPEKNCLHTPRAIGRGKSRTTRIPSRGSRRGRRGGVQRRCRTGSQAWSWPWANSLSVLLLVLKFRAEPMLCCDYTPPELGTAVTIISYKRARKEAIRLVSFLHQLTGRWAQGPAPAGPLAPYCRRSAVPCTPGGRAAVSSAGLWHSASGAILRILPG
jgi:hypothetical protein